MYSRREARSPALWMYSERRDPSGKDLNLARARGVVGNVKTVRTVDD